MTMGNHTFAKKELFQYIDEADRLIVPYNQPKALPGVGSREIMFQNRKIRVTNLLGITLWMESHKIHLKLLMKF